MGIGASITAEIENGKYVNFVSPSIEPLYSMMARLIYQWLIESFFKELMDFHLNIVDVGACIGSWGVILAHKYPMHNFVCIEPCKENYDCLVHNAKGTPNVRTINMAADSQHGTVSLSLPNLKDWEVNHKPIELYKNYGLITAYGENGRDRFDVECSPLDDLVDKVDILKIDVEGMELRVLEGAKRIITECKPIIEIEILDRNQERAGNNIEEIEKVIRSYGYLKLDNKDGADFIFFPKGGKKFER